MIAASSLEVSLGQPIACISPIERSWGEHLRARLDLANGDVVFLKERPEYLSVREFAGLREALCLLSDRGAPVPRKPASVPALVRYRGLALWLEEFKVSGTPPGPVDPAVAVALASFHREAEAVSLWRRHRHRRPAQRWLHQSDAPTWLARRLEMTVLASQRGAQRKAARLGMEQLLDSVPWHHGPMPRPRLLHGDPASENAVLDAVTGLVTLVDFDDARWGEPEYDVLQYLVREIHERQDARDPAMIDNFLATYREREPLSQQRLSALLPLVSAATAAIEFDLMASLGPSPDDWLNAVAMARLARSLLGEVLAR
ncbi:MAG: phosphotransferase [Mycobacterium sp.]